MTTTYISISCNSEDKVACLVARSCCMHVFLVLILTITILYAKYSITISYKKINFKKKQFMLEFMKNIV